MLNHPTLDKLLALKRTGMAKALGEQRALPESQTLTCAERLGLLVERELTARSERRLLTRLRQAQLRLSASLEDIDYRHPRGLDKALLLRLASCQWLHDRHHGLITGPPGSGKTWLSCALGHQACREGDTVLSLRLPRLLQELPMAKGDGRYPKLMASLAKTAFLILDDWGLATLNDAHRRDVRELLEDRHGRGATSVTSQCPVEHWHEALGDPTLADAILDRLLHNAYKMTLRGESMRKRHATVKNDGPTMEPDQSRRRCAPMGWQLSSGCGGRLPPDCMAALHWIGWQESPEYAVLMAR
jgi:DNA replication protein DnaC